jgi:hypothetical protein
MLSPTSGWMCTRRRSPSQLLRAAAAAIRQIGVFENRPEVLGKLAARLSKSGRRLSFCYEAGPCGYGLHRLLTGYGHDASWWRRR